MSKPTPQRTVLEFTKPVRAALKKRAKANNRTPAKEAVQIVVDALSK